MEPLVRNASEARSHQVCVLRIEGVVEQSHRNGDVGPGAGAKLVETAPRSLR